MKMILTLTVVMLCTLAGAALAVDSKLPIDKRIAMEKALLTEEYQASLKKCHQYKIRAAKNTCVRKYANALTETFEELQNDPAAYFAAKENKNLNEKDMEEARKVSTRKGP